MVEIRRDAGVLRAGIDAAAHARGIALDARELAVSITSNAEDKLMRTDPASERVAAVYRVGRELLGVMPVGDESRW
jgi:hypothetical protein